ncbi:MAG: hypothetical protein BMS9Abin02_1326 [Anaerolineae bacterium]|nr:MAG: hypothetical protein BMS9Abin02_1326 [Anaerolineae bacterium]
MTVKPKKGLVNQKRSVFRKRRRRRRRGDDLFSYSNGFMSPDQLPADKSAQTLRQEAMVQAQQVIGNRGARRLIKSNGRSEKQTLPSIDGETALTSADQQFGKENGHQTGETARLKATTPADNGRKIEHIHENGKPNVQRGFWSWIKKGVSKVAGAIAKGVSKVAKAVAGGAKKVFRGIKRGASKLARGVRKVVSVVGNKLKKGAKGLIKGVKSFAKQAWGGIKKFAGKLGKGVKKVWGKFKDAARRVGEAVGGTAKWIGKTLTKGVKKVGKFIKKGVNFVGKAVRKGIKKAGNFISKAAKSVVKGLKNIWAGITGAAKSVFGKVKRLASKYWNKAKSFAKKMVGKAKNFAKKLWSKAKNLAKKIKNKIKKVFGPVWKWLNSVKDKIWNGIKWVSKKLWEKFQGIFHRVKGWFAMLPQRLGRLFGHLWKGVKSLKPWSLKWWKSLGKASTWMDFLKWSGESLIYLLEAAGIGEVYETVMDFIKFNTRPLKGDEIAKAQEVFGSAIDYELVRVDENALLGPSWTDREYVSFHTINGWGTLDDHTLIHELTHVWQYEEMGAKYMPKAIHAQQTGGYNYGGLAELIKRKNAGKGITSFNLEQQGQILGDYYVKKKDGSIGGSSLATYEHFVNQVRT